MLQHLLLMVSYQKSKNLSCSFQISLESVHILHMRERYDVETGGRVTQTTNSISVIICAYTPERWSDLVAAVESVQQQLLPAAEIIVVIDHNPDLLKRAQEHIPGVVVVENTEATGASGSRNSGIAVAKGQIIACLDDDALATEDWLKCLNEGFTDPQVLGVGGAIDPLWQAKYPAWFPEEFYWVVGCTYRGMPQTAAAIRNLIGANMSLRREVFDTVGGFRSEIGRIGSWPIGCEETELCIRALQHWPEGVFLYLPKAKVFQRVPNKRACLRYFCLRCYAEGLSKAVVTQYVGAKDGLACEYTYVLKTLPQGIVRSLTNVLFHRDLTGFARVGVIVLGLSLTTTGYLIGTAFLWIRRLRDRTAGNIALPSSPNYHHLASFNTQEEGDLIKQ
jgi:hypothetical protein